MSFIPRPPIETRRPARAQGGTGLANNPEASSPIIQSRHNLNSFTARSSPVIFSKLYRATIRLAPLAMLACLLAGGAAQAQSAAAAKISPDLSARLRKDASGKRVNTIVQFNKAPGSVLDNLLLNLG